MGFKWIEYLKEKEFDIPVIICSTNNYESVPDVFGSVWYSEFNDIKREFRKIIEKLQENDFFSYLIRGL